MSTQELIKELKEAEKVLFDLRFKKATRQPFKPHQIKATKKKVATFKGFLAMITFMMLVGGAPSLISLIINFINSMGPFFTLFIILVFRQRLLFLYLANYNKIFVESLEL